GAPAPLPATAVAMIGRIPPVNAVTPVGYVAGVTVRRTAAIPTIETGGVTVIATGTNLLDTLGAHLRTGVFLNPATANYPVVVLGAAAAKTLGVDTAGPDTLVYIDGRSFTVIGILDP